MNLGKNVKNRSNEQLCLDRIEECFLIAEKAYGVKIPRPAVKFSTAMTRCAGSARSYRDGTPVMIKLSSTLLKLNGDAFIARTPGHEAAHIIQAFMDKGSDGHGWRWIRVMHLLGQSAERCHNMEVPKGNGVELVCSCTTHTVKTMRRATRLVNGGGKCKLCKSGLKFKRDGVIPTPVVKPVVVKKVKVPKVKKVVVRVKGTKTFATICREKVAANPLLSFDDLVMLCIPHEPSRNKAKVKSYLRHILVKELGRSI